MLAFKVLLCDEDTLTEEVLVDLLALGSGDKHLVGVVLKIGERKFEVGLQFPKSCSAETERRSGSLNLSDHVLALLTLPSTKGLTRRVTLAFLQRLVKPTTIIPFDLIVAEFHPREGKETTTTSQSPSRDHGNHQCPPFHFSWPRTAINTLYTHLFHLHHIRLQLRTIVATTTRRA